MKEDNNSQLSILNSPLIPPGYKQTEVGMIPEDWEVVQLGDLKPFVTSGSRGWAFYYSEQGSLFVRITNLSRDTIYLNLKDSKFVTLPLEANEGTRTELKEHDVLISITADIGIVGYVDFRIPGPAYINQHIALVRFDITKTCSKFVGYFLASEKPQKLFRASTDVGAKAGMSLLTVKKLQLACPPTKVEQEAIAEALSDADALIESLEQLLTKKRHLKQGAMQELLTGKKRLPGFEVKPGYKQTEVGMISQDWNVVPLSKLGKFKNGINKNSEAFGHGNPFVNLMDVFGVSSIASSEGLGLVDTNNAEQQTYDLRKGDVIFIRSSVKPSGVGLTAVLKADLPKTVYSGFLIRFRDGGVLGDGFKRHCFYEEGFRKRVIDASSVSANTNINQDNLKRLLLPLPPTIAEQESIAAILSDMDAEIAALEAKLTKTRQLKQGMMQELLTGKIRLV